MRIKHKKVVPALALGVVGVSSGVAYAYYATSIDSSDTAGSATTAANTAQNIQATLQSEASGLVPGAAGQTLTVLLTNPNDYSVGVTGRTLTLDFARSTSTGVGCTPDKALLSAAPVTGYEHVFEAGGTDTVAFTVAMADSLTVDQTVCAGATFTVPVVVS